MTVRRGSMGGPAIADLRSELPLGETVTVRAEFASVEN